MTQGKLKPLGLYLPICKMGSIINPCLTVGEASFSMRRWMGKWGILRRCWKKQALGAGVLGRDRASGGPGGARIKRISGTYANSERPRARPVPICTPPGTGNPFAWAVPDLLSGISPMVPGDTSCWSPGSAGPFTLASSVTLEDWSGPQNKTTPSSFSYFWWDLTESLSRPQSPHLWIVFHIWELCSWKKK